MQNDLRRRRDGLFADQKRKSVFVKCFIYFIVFSVCWYSLSNSGFSTVVSLLVVLHLVFWSLCSQVRWICVVNKKQCNLMIALVNEGNYFFFEPILCSNSIYCFPYVMVKMNNISTKVPMSLQIEGILKENQSYSNKLWHNHFNFRMKYTVPRAVDIGGDFKTL